MWTIFTSGGFATVNCCIKAYKDLQNICKCIYIYMAYGWCDNLKGSYKEKVL